MKEGFRSSASKQEHPIITPIVESHPKKDAMDALKEKKALEAAIARLQAKEAREKLTLKEKLQSALGKLPDIINGLATGSWERMRAEHTLDSVRGALQKLGKDGAPDGTYAVAVEGYEGNPQKPYAQNEGVPVDELIHVLQDSAKELNKNFPTKKSLTDLKDAMQKAGEEYHRTIEVTEKARKYNEWLAAQEEYREKEEEFDTGPSDKVRDLEALARDLYKHSKTYFEAHYTKAHGEGGTWTKEEQEKQDLRTRHEAKLISLDYRNTGSEGGNYEAAKEVLKYRRELDLSEKEEQKPEPPLKVPEQTPWEKPDEPPREPEAEEPPKKPEEPPMTPTEPPPPTKPEELPTPTPEPKLQKPERARRIAIVDAKAQVELMARKRGAELLNERLNQRSWLKKKWTQMWEEGYRQQFVNEERKKILGQENRPGFVRRAMFGANSFDATGEKNLFAGTGAEAQNKAELGSLAVRFAEDFQRQSEGEVKTQMNDPEFSTKINDLIFAFASGAVSESAFEDEKEKLVSQISQKYPDTFAAGGLTADNILEAAQDFRAAYLHGGALKRQDVNLEIDLGIAKQAIKTEANLNWVDKVVSGTQKYLGPGISPEAIGFGVSIGSYFARKPLYWLGGAAGIGGLMGAMRRNVEQKKDLEMHRSERAMGAVPPTSGAERRETAEKFVYEMRPASDIAIEVRKLSSDFETSPSEATAAALTKALADAEARQSLSESRHGDLISFTGEITLERGRLDFMRTLAEAKVALKNGGFDSDIEKTDAYRDAHAALAGDMDKIDRSERGHRWSENGKAAITGAIGGLVVGGLTQEALAFAGDHINMLHWLRPGGKATSVENLYHYLNGDMPTAPTGAGMQQALGLSMSNSTIKIDGTTELVPDPTTGLMNLVDKSDPSRILAHVSVDSTGHVTPVPGSYDPNLISFNETKAGGGTQTLQQWFSSMKGKFGGNVTEDTWHTKGYLDNDTLPKTEFNELKLFMKYDAGGNLAIDASKLQEYAQNAAAEQIQGSKHGSTVLDVAGQFARGSIKIGIAPDTANPTSVLELKYDAGTHTFVAPKGSHIMDFFEADAKGHPVLKGDGVLGIVHELGAAQDGSKNVEWVNAVRGNHHPITTGEADRIVTEIGRRNPLTWWGPWVWSFGRKPLEERQEGLINAEGKYADFKPEHFEGHGPEDEKHIAGVKIAGATVETRGQKISDALDKKDWGAEYPEKFPFQSEKEMAEYLVSQGNFFMSLRDREKYVTLAPAAKVDFLTARIKKDRESLEVANGKPLTKEGIERIVDVVLKQTDKMFNKYGEKGRSQLPAKEKIHVVGATEYQAQTKLANDSSLGICFHHSGEIFVNFDLLKFGLTAHGEGDPNILISQLKRTIAHEVTHDTVANNYWRLETDTGENVPVQRRSGLLFLRRRAKPGSAGEQVLLERGRGLNEAITETLAKHITDAIYKAEGTKPPRSILEPYSAERDVLETLMKKRDIPFDLFAKASVDRKALHKLVETLDGKSAKAKESYPQFTSLLLSIMDYEFSTNSNSYVATKRFIQGKKGIVVTRAMKKYFATNHLDDTGGIKQKLVDTYKFLDEDKMQKAA